MVYGHSSDMSASSSSNGQTSSPVVVRLPKITKHRRKHFNRGSSLGTKTSSPGQEQPSPSRVVQAKKKSRKRRSKKSNIQNLVSSSSSSNEQSLAVTPKRRRRKRRRTLSLDSPSGSSTPRTQPLVSSQEMLSTPSPQARQSVYNWGNYSTGSDSSPVNLSMSNLEKLIDYNIALGYL